MKLKPENKNTFGNGVYIGMMTWVAIEGIARNEDHKWANFVFALILLIAVINILHIVAPKDKHKIMLQKYEMWCATLIIAGVIVFNLI